MSRSIHRVNMLFHSPRQMDAGHTRRSERKPDLALGPAANILAIVLMTVAAQAALGCDHGCEPVAPSQGVFYPADVLSSDGSYAGKLDSSSRCPKTPPASPYVIQAPEIYSAEGEYVGKFSRNRYDDESISNPYGRYGNKYSRGSLFNPYGKHGKWSGGKFYIVPRYGEREAVTRDQILRSLRRN